MILSAKRIPLLLILFRLILGPVIIAISLKMEDNGRILILILMYLGLISDILDGIIARKTGTATPSLRRMDSQADLVFWLCVGYAAYLLSPEPIQNNEIPILAIFYMEAMCYIISFFKFGRETCTHAFLSKIWGLSLLTAFTSLIGFGYAGIPFYTAIVLGIASHIDRILITLILPVWTHDIPSTYHAYLIRKGKSFKKNKFLN